MFEFNSILDFFIYKAIISLEIYLYLMASYGESIKLELAISSPLLTYK